jgi:hypothetical protein
MKPGGKSSCNLIDQAPPAEELRPALLHVVGRMRDKGASKTPLNLTRFKVAIPALHPSSFEKVLC